MPLGGLEGGGGGSAIIEVANYSALPSPIGLGGDLYAVLASQGTKWLPGSLGGTYYPKGLYYSDNVNWVFTETPYNANQATVDAGTNDDQFVTSKTFNDSAQLAAKAPLASPTFTGNPQAPTPATNDNDQSIATTEFVQNQIAVSGVSNRLFNYYNFI